MGACVLAPIDGSVCCICVLQDGCVWHTAWMTWKRELHCVAGLCPAPPLLGCYLPCRSSLFCADTGPGGSAHSKTRSHSILLCSFPFDVTQCTLGCARPRSQQFSCQRLPVNCFLSQWLHPGSLMHHSQHAAAPLVHACTLYYAMHAPWGRMLRARGGVLSVAAP